MSDAVADDAPRRYIFGLVVVRPSEVAAVAYAWLYIFSLLMTYYIMRPAIMSFAHHGNLR